MQSLRRKYLGAWSAMGIVAWAFTSWAHAGVLNFSDIAPNIFVPNSPMTPAGIPAGVTATFTDFRSYSGSLADHTGDTAAVYIWQADGNPAYIDFNATVEVPSFYIYVDSWCPNPSVVYGYANGVQVWQGSADYTGTGYANITAGAGIEVDQLRFAASYARVDDLTVNFVRFNGTQSTWNKNGSGEWSAPGNWDAGGVPVKATSRATFGAAITSNQTVLVNTDTTLGGMDFDNAGSSYFIQGPASLTISNGATTADISVLHGTHVLTPGKLNFVSDTNINLASGTKLTIGGYLNGMWVDAGKTVTKTGTGNLTVVGEIHLGTGSSFHLGLAPSIALASPLVTAGVTGSGYLDLTNNKVIIPGGNLATVESQIVSGQITSSLAASAGHSNVVAVGSLTGADYLTLTGASFGGAAVVASDIVVGLTYAGDINLDGTVTAADLAGIKLGGTHWVDGDFNHDGTVDFADIALADAAYTLLTGSAADAVVQADELRFGTAFDIAYQAALQGGTPSAVPEPASVSLLALGAAMLLKRRK